MSIILTAIGARKESKYSNIRIFINFIISFKIIFGSRRLVAKDVCVRFCFFT